MLDVSALCCRYGRIPALWGSAPPPGNRTRIVGAGQLLALVERTISGFRFLRVFPPAEPGTVTE